MKNLQIIPVKTPILSKNPIEEIIKTIKKRKIKIKDGDILVIASKIVALKQGKLVKLDEVKTTQKALKLALEYRLKPEIAQLILQEADEILGGVSGAVLTQKNNITIANAGIDESNVPLGQAILWPEKIEKEVEEIKNFIEREFHQKIGVVIVDSTCAPLRRGTRGVALAIAGFSGMIDERGKEDLFNKKMRITTRNLADQIASAASLVMGERKEKIPAVIISGLKIKLTNKPAKQLSKELLIDKKDCLFGRNL